MRRLGLQGGRGGQNWVKFGPHSKDSIITCGYNTLGAILAPHSRKLLY